MAVFLYTHISYIMEWPAPLILPVRFSVKLNTIHPRWELLLCDQIVDLTSGVSQPVAGNSGIFLHTLNMLIRHWMEDVWCFQPCMFPIVRTR